MKITIKKEDAEVSVEADCLTIDSLIEIAVELLKRVIPGSKIK